MRRSSNGKGAVGDDDLLRECMSLVAVLTLPEEQVASSEKASTLPTAMEKMNQVRDSVLFDASSPEAIAANGLHSNVARGRRSGSI